LRSYKVTISSILVSAILYGFVLYFTHTFIEGYTSEQETPYNVKKHNKVIVVTHTEFGDIINHIGAVSFLSTIYDEVCIFAKKNTAKKLQQFFSHLPNVVFHEYAFDGDVYSKIEDVKSELKQYETTHDIRVAGHFNAIQSKPVKPFNDIPFNFYEDLDVDPALFFTHSRIIPAPESLELYNTIKHLPYIFISTNTSSGHVFDVEFIEKKFNIMRDSTLIISSDANVYPPDHAYYAHANRFVMLPFTHYVDTIIHASKVILTDSSICCMSFQLPIITEECYYVPRRPDSDYGYVWDSKYGYDKTSGKKIFKKLEK
jgi:hypothetical protein